MAIRNLEDADLFTLFDACYASEKFGPNLKLLSVAKFLCKGNQVFLVLSVRKKRQINMKSHQVFTYYLLDLKSERIL